MKSADLAEKTASAETTGLQSRLSDLRANGESHGEPTYQSTDHQQKCGPVRVTNLDKYESVWEFAELELSDRAGQETDKSAEGEKIAKENTLKIKLKDNDEKILKLESKLQSLTNASHVDRNRLDELEAFFKTLNNFDFKCAPGDLANQQKVDLDQIIEISNENSNIQVKLFHFRVFI